MAVGWSGCFCLPDALLRAAGLALALLLAVPAPAAAPEAALGYHATLVNGAQTGSSFMIAEGLAVTNAHVLAGRRPGDRVTLYHPGTGRAMRAEVLAISRRIDLAVLRVPGRFLPVPPAQAAAPGRGGAVVAAGVVAGQGPGARRAARGHVLRTGQAEPGFGPGLVARMSGAAPGFSGGPVLDGQGRLIGMLSGLRPPRGNTREAYILSAEAIRVETRRLTGRR